MERVVKFLEILKDNNNNNNNNNNNKDWFDDHRNEWKEIQAIFNAYTLDLIEGISSFDPTVKGLGIRDCTYRINRDIRFSKNKTPYKTHIGAYIAPKGKKSGYAGYYFHVEPKNGDLLGHSSLSAGLYMPEPVILRSVRDEIFDNGTALIESIDNSGGFILNKEYTLKRTPKGFPNDSKFDELLKLKQFFIEKQMPDSSLLFANLLNETIIAFEKTTPFINILNRAVKYGYEEMM